MHTGEHVSDGVSLVASEGDGVDVGTTGGAVWPGKGPALRVRGAPLRRRSTLAAVALLTVGALGCHRVPEGMRGAELPASYAPPEGQAAVIFVRPAPLEKMVDFPIVDARRHWLASLRAVSHTVLFVPPGEHTFYVVAANAEAVQGNLEAGLTYIVEVHPVFTRARPNVRLDPVHAGEEEAEGPELVARTPALISVQSEGDAWLQDNRKEVWSLTRRADRARAAMDDAQRARLTLRPDDGLTAEQLGL